MNISRRRFSAGVVATCAGGLAGLAAPRAFAAVRSGERPALLPQAMNALDSHVFRIRNRDLLGLVDFSEPSGQPRFHIVDIAGGRVIATHLVAHGRGSDPANTGWLRSFSNRPGSNASCHGSFMTGGGYYGEHGRSRRLIGLDAENSNAASRAIVIHAADYVSPAMASAQGRIGRSLGCFAVSRRDIHPVLDALGEGRLLFAGR